MRRSWLSVLVAVLLVGLAGADEAKPPAAGEGPRIALEPASFDFGPALGNKTLTKEFSIRNFGNADLVIENVSTTCGCTAALLNEKDKVLKPGGTASLKVELQTRTAQGALQKTVLIRSNDPTKTLYELKLQAQVAPAK